MRNGADKMNLQRLEQYLDKVREIEMLENSIKELKEKPSFALYKE